MKANTKYPIVFVALCILFVHTIPAILSNKGITPPIKASRVFGTEIEYFESAPVVRDDGGIENIINLKDADIPSISPDASTAAAFDLTNQGNIILMENGLTRIFVVR